MLAYQTGFPLDYDIALTVFSIVIAVALCGGGFALAVMGGRAFAGGALTGSAIGIMHYVGMAAVRAPAREIWDFRYVAVSLVIGILAMAFGMLLVMRNKELRGYMLGATVFTLAICSMHFTGMSAVTFRYDPLIPATTGILAPDTLAIAIAAIAALILGLGLVTAVVDHHLAARTASEAVRLRKHIVELETTKAELEQSLRERAIALTKADMASRSKSAFLAAMSHELRTPLNAIIGFSEMMSLEAFGALGNPLYRNYSQDIHRSGKHLLSLISDILDISRLEAGKAELHEEAVDVATLVEDCLRMVEHQAENGGLMLETDMPRDLPRVLADERRLKQVLLNLLSNAIKFTQRGGRIVVQARVSDEGLFSVGRGFGHRHRARRYRARLREIQPGRFHRRAPSAGRGSRPASVAPAHGTARGHADIGECRQCRHDCDRGSAGLADPGHVAGRGLRLTSDSQSLSRPLISPPGSRRARRSLTWSGRERSSHTESDAGRRLPPPQRNVKDP